MSEGTMWRAGTTAYDYFDYNVPSLSTGDFTIQVDKDGIADSNAGITITYIADQRYVVTINGATSFIAATGQYNVTIFRTSITDDRWQSQWTVTNTGLPTGTVGAASFTATASNGRVTEGVSPIESATVYIYRPTGTLYATTTTAATGLWGPVSFDTNGTWTLTVQRSGYTVGGASIVVSGATATGPGTDIVLTAAAAGSGLTLSSLLAYARRMYRDRTSTKTDTELTQAVNEAVLWCSTQHLWPWYSTLGRININPSYDTGTVTCTSGSAVVSLVGGVFPSWSADADLYINGMYHEVLSRDSDTQVTLANSWQETTYTGSYTICQTAYTLPSDCMRLDKITSGTDWIWGADPVSRFTLEEARNQWRMTAQTPARIWAISRNQIVLWPMPSTQRMVNVLYFRRPATLVSSLDEADWDPNLISLLHRAIDYQIAIRGDCVAGSKEECFAALREDLARSIAQDRTSTTRRVGFQTGWDQERIYNATISP
jgi:hypothetical protein